MVMSNDTNLQRIFERLGGMFDQDGEANVTLEGILAELEMEEAAAPASIPVADLVYENLRDPDNADTPDMNVNGLAADRTFRWTASVRTSVERVNFGASNNAKDVPNGFFSFGDLGSGNGCLIKAHDAADVVLKDFLDGGEIRLTAGFDLIAGVDVDSDTVANLSHHSVRWTIGKSGAMGIFEIGEYIEFTIRADLSGLEFFQAQVQGRPAPAA